MADNINTHKRSAASFTPNIDIMRLANPLGDDTLTLSALPYSKQEGALVDEYFDGRQLMYMNGIDELISQLSNAPLIHFGAHVVLDNQFPEYSYMPYINAEQKIEKIYSKEFYNQPLHSDLVIVNACHSGAGKIVTGRGLLSFISGLARSKTKCIQSSRWAVQDKLSFDLMKNMLSTPKKKNSIGHSLHQAQLNILDRNDPVYSHPTYWASFYLIGDVNLTIPGTGWDRWIFIGVILLVLVCAGCFAFMRS